MRIAEFDTATNTQTDPQWGSTEPGAESDIYDCFVKKIFYSPVYVGCRSCDFGGPSCQPMLASTSRPQSESLAAAAAAFAVTAAAPVAVSIHVCHYGSSV